MTQLSTGGPAETHEQRAEAVARLTGAFKGALVAVRRLRGRDTHRHGELSYAQCQLLFGLAERGELTTGELALAADLAPATVTAMLDHLEGAGLVERTRSLRDRRVVTCTLSAHGRQLVEARLDDFRARWQAQLGAFSASELELAATVLERVRELYDELGARAAQSA